MVDSFFTIENEKYKAEIVEKKSRFIATLLKVDSEDSALKRIAEIKKESRNAKHNVFAYRIANSTEKFSDDGEPSGTAGKPILDILRGEELQNILLVVTRYFGGILLGTGGLVRAYSTVAKQVVSSAIKSEEKLCNEFDVWVEYNYYDTLLYYFREEGILIKNTEFSDKICLNILVERTRTQVITDNISDKTDRKATIVAKETYYHA